MSRQIGRLRARLPLLGALCGACLLPVVGVAQHPIPRGKVPDVANVKPTKAARTDTVAQGARVADAAMHGDAAAVRTLIAARMNVNAAQGDGMTGLHWAAERGDLAVTELLLRSGAKLTATSRIGAYTPLHIAAKNGHGMIVLALLKAGADANAATTTGATALHLAATAGDPNAVTALLQNKADPNARESEWGQTPLMFAAAANRGEAISVLLKNRADPKVATKTVNLLEEASREQAAAKRRNEVLLSYLPKRTRDSLKAIADSTASAAAAAVAATRQAGVASMQAAGTVSPQAAAVAAAAAAAPTTTPAKVAAVQGAVTPAAGVAAASSGATAALPGASTITPPAGGALEALAPPPGRGSNEAPPTQLLTPRQIQDGIAAGREALLSAKTGGLTPFTENADSAAQAGFEGTPGYEGTVGAMGGLSALHHAIRQGNTAAALALLDGGADIDQRTLGDSTTPLLMAAINGHFDLAMQLVQRGANVKLASVHGSTPLYAAINTQWLPRSRFPQPQSVQNQKTTHLELMEALIKAGADVNVRLTKNLWYFGYNNCGNANCGLEYLDGTTPFWRAAYGVDVDAMRLLKKHGADHTLPSFRVVAGRAGRGGAGMPGAPDAPGAPGAGRGGAGGGGYGGPPAPALDPVTDSASKAVPPGVGVYPIHATAGVGYGNGFAGNSHRHAPDGWMPALKYMVEELGADVNQRDLTGYTPLHHAAARGDNAMILYLVSKGADVKAVSRNGRTTVDMANGPVQRLSPIPETIALLEKLGAKNSHRCVSC